MTKNPAVPLSTGTALAALTLVLGTAIRGRGARRGFNWLGYQCSRAVLIAAARVGTLILAWTSADACRADAPSPDRGLELLLNRPYVDAAFDQEAFDAAWQQWEEPLRGVAANASPDERRKMAYRRYGLVERPGDAQHRPMQFVVDPEGRWTINCLACHQGTVNGKLVPGAPNAQFAMETLISEVRAAKFRLGKPWSNLDRGALLIPLGTTIGTTNAVAFGVAVMHYRDADMNILHERAPPTLVHHDVDAPAWWNTGKKARLYCDGFAPRGRRALMQFIAGRENAPEKFREWEDDFRHIEAYINGLEPPDYPLAIDHGLAAEGKKAFNSICAACHGTYDDSGKPIDYPERIVPLDELGVDAVRLGALTVEHRRDWGLSWINEYGARGAVIAEPSGYVAPLLSGAWASAPYFHNGSVPTLWHVLHPESRPIVWARPSAEFGPAVASVRHQHGSAGPEPETIRYDEAPDGKLADEMANDFDAMRVGLKVAEMSEIPPNLSGPAERRRYFDTRRKGKSAAGHEFPMELTVEQRRAVLEYLKTL